jgi:hypothetical protein
LVGNVQPVTNGFPSAREKDREGRLDGRACLTLKQMNADNGAYVWLEPKRTRATDGKSSE